MATVEGVPALEELSLVNVRGEQCMPGDETNLGELLLTAANTTSENVCLEVEAESYTFAQVRQTCESLFTFKIMISVHCFLPWVHFQIAAWTDAKHCQTDLDLPSSASHQRRADEHVVTIVLDRGVKSIASVHLLLCSNGVLTAHVMSESGKTSNLAGSLSSPSHDFQFRCVREPGIEGHCCDNVLDVESTSSTLRPKSQQCGLGFEEDR